MPGDGDIQSPFADVLDDLRHLAREHLLFFRCEVGRIILQRFFGGDSRAYLSQYPDKEATFVEFMQRCQPQLQGWKLGGQTLRNCVLCYLVVKTLPEATLDALEFSHVVELTRVPDQTLRARLADSTVDNAWTVRDLKGAIDEAMAGRWFDTQPEAPGTQPPAALPPPPEPTGKVQPGRLVTRAEKWVTSIDDLAQMWARVDPTQVPPRQKKRMAAALRAARARLDKLAAEFEG